LSFDWFVLPHFRERRADTGAPLGSWAKCRGGVRDCRDAGANL